MKARALRGAIRKHSKVWIETRFGRVNLEKQSLLEALNQYDNDHETASTVKDDGQLTGEPT